MHPLYRTQKSVSIPNGAGISHPRAVVRAGDGRNESRPHISWIVAVPDFLMIAYGVGFFAIAILYVLACEKM